MKTIKLLMLTFSLGLAALSGKPASAAIFQVAGGPYSSAQDCRSSATITSLTWQQTIQSAIYPLLVVAVVTPLGTVSSVTFNGFALTQKAAAFNDLAEVNTNATGVKAEVWYLECPPVGTYNIVVSLSGGVRAIGAIGAQYRNVDQTAPLDTATTTLADPPANAVSSQVSGTVYQPYWPSIRRGMVLDVVGLERLTPMGGWAAGADQTQRGFEDICGVMGIALSEKPSNGGIVTMSGGSVPSVVDYCIAHVAVEVRPPQ